MASCYERVRKTSAVSGLYKVYKTIQHAGTTEITVKKSRFIGCCYPIQDETDASRQLESVRRTYWDASHHCYAYRIGVDARITRSSDDGEPAGTAGVPVLQGLIRLDLVNVLCIVTRYFGGVLLGGGGLIRAYSEASTSTIENAGTVLMYPCTAYEMIIPYSLLAVVERVAEDYGGLCERLFTDTVRAVVWVRETDSSTFLARINAVTNGRILPESIALDYRSFVGTTA